MDLTSTALAASEKNCYFKRKGSPEIYYSMPAINLTAEVKADNQMGSINAKRMSSVLCRVKGSLLIPIFLPYQDAVALDWELHYDQEIKENDRKSHAGIIRADGYSLEAVLSVLENVPDLEIVTWQRSSLEHNIWLVYVNSPDLIPNENGKPTKTYTLEKNDVSGEVKFRPL